MLEDLTDKYLAFRYSDDCHIPSKSVDSSDNCNASSPRPESSAPEDSIAPAPYFPPPNEPSLVPIADTATHPTNVSPSPSSAGPARSQASDAASPADPDLEQNTTAATYPYTVTLLDIYSLKAEATVMRDQSSLSPALDLMAHGLVAKTPVRPTVAVSVSTLELLYRLRQRKASFSVEAFTKVLCDYYKVSRFSVEFLRWCSSCLCRHRIAPFCVAS